MKVAVTYENGEVFQHFGRTPQFKVYEISDGNVVSSEVVDTNGAKVLICGGIGGGALAAMNEAGIQLFAGASGNADEAVNSYLAGTLPPVGEATCDHHDHEHHEGHECAHGGKCHE